MLRITRKECYQDPAIDKAGRGGRGPGVEGKRPEPGALFAFFAILRGFSSERVAMGQPQKNAKTAKKESDRVPVELFSRHERLDCCFRICRFIAPNSI